MEKAEVNHFSVDDAGLYNRVIPFHFEFIKLFDQNLSLTGGGPVNSTQMLALNIYNTAFGENRFGLAQSKAVIFMIVVMAISIIQLTVTKKREVEA